MNTVKCPECGKVLKTANPIAPGKKVRCPGCKEIFTMPAAKPSSSTAVRSKTAVPPKPPPVDDDDEDMPRPKRKRRDEEEEDVDDEEEEEEERPRKKKKKKKQAGPNWVLIGGAGGGVVVLVLILGFIWPGFFKGSAGGAAGPGPAAAGGLAQGTGQENLLAFMPAGALQVFGGDAGRIPTFIKAPFEKLVQMSQQQGGGGLPPGVSAGVEEILNDAGKFVLGAKGEGPQATIVLAVMMKTPFDLKKIGKMFQTESIPAKEHQGKTYFNLPNSVPGGHPVFVGVPNNRIVLVGGMPEEEFKGILTGDGQQSRLAPPVQALVGGVDKHYLWGAFMPDDQAKQQMIGPAEMVPELKLGLGALAGMKGLTLWLEESASDKQKLTIALTCANEQDAGMLNKSFNDLWKKGRAMVAGLGFMAAQPGKEGLKDVVNDAASLKIENKGAVTAASVAFSEKTLKALEQMVQEMMPNPVQAPPPGMVRPQGSPPGKQPVPKK